MAEESSQVCRSGRWGAWAAAAALSLLGLPAGAAPLPALPEAVASFGGVVLGSQLYVYGGHVGQTHQHSLQNLSSAFRRLDLTVPERGWEELGPVPPLQGLPLVAHRGRVCRVGGLRALNAQGEPEDLRSTAEVACFDPAARTWTALPPLPTPRSSHDAVVLGDRLYVVGGWQLLGAGEKPVWQDSMAVLDLAAAAPAWAEVPQPFRRRALALAAAEGRLFALGGLGEVGGTSRRVDVYDPATGTWREGPELPEITGGLKGFGVSACGVGGRVFLSGADGVVHTLDAGASAWGPTFGRLAQPRFFHRLLASGDQLLFVGGASSDGHLASVEALPLGKGALGPQDLPAREEPAEVGAQVDAAWPGFRGHGDGRVARDLELPTRWSASENLAWRVRVPGYGQSQPVVWGGTVFVTSSEGPEKETLILSAFDAASGEVRWRRRFPASQRLRATDTVSRAAPTPTVDAERVYAFWESGDLVAVSHEGETLWQRSLTSDYGPFAGNHGVASSPVLTREALVVQVTHDGPSYFVAIDKATGQNRWKVERPTKVAWTTPSVVDGPRGQELVSSASGRVEALDAATGERLWLHEGVERNNAPSAAVVGDLVVVPSSDPAHNFALRRRAEGGTESVTVAWRADGVSSGFGSPAVAAGCALFTNKAGVLTCLDLESGEKRWTHRLPTEAWASPIAVGERLYVFTKQGATAVLDIGCDGAAPVAENELPTTDTVYGVAAAPGAFFIRTGTELVRVGVPASTPGASLASAAVP